MLFLKTRQIQRARTPRPARPALPLALSLETSLTAFLLPLSPVFGTVLACPLPDKPVFCGLSITTDLSGMARTRAGLSGRPTCRPGVICPGLSAPQGWPLEAMPAGLPVGTLRPCLTSAVDQPRAASRPSFSSFPAKGRPVLPSCLGCWFSWPWCRTGAAFWAWWWCHPARLAAPRQRVMAAGHPFIGRGSRPKVGGTPKGCPGRRPQKR